jgi:HD superfamily phosphohydrolase
MSHVSENALKHFEDVEDMRLDFAEAQDIEEASLSEIAAYFIIGSPAFRRLITLIEELLRVRDLPPESVDLMQAAVLGKQVSDDVPLLHELISGPFDADKLDYMTRDAQMTGVPVVTDIPRLVQKVRAMHLPVTELPAEVQRVVRRDNAAYWLTGVALSGGRTLDELLIGRTFLFDKLYRHQKVRAAEAMVASLFREVAGLHAEGAAMFPYSMDDAAILELDQRRLTTQAGRKLTARERTSVGVAVDVAQRLKRRELFVRAYAFAQNMPLDPYRGDRTHTQGLRDLARECNDPVQREQLVDAICDELKRILKTLDLEELLGALPGKAVKPYLWLDPPQPPKGGTIISQAYLLGGARHWLRFGEETAEAPGWTNAYLLTRDVGYVFTVLELAPFAFLAAERVFRERFKVRTPRTMYGYAKQDETVIDHWKTRLSERDYYDGAPFDLRPRPARLSKGDVGVRLAEFAERFAGYQGPVSTEDLREEKRVAVITPERAEDWLRQFKDDDLIEAGLRVLDHVEFVGRTDLVRGLDEFLEEHDAFRDGVLSRLGALQDSSSILAYEAVDAGRVTDYGQLKLEPLCMKANQSSSSTTSSGVARRPSRYSRAGLVNHSLTIWGRIADSSSATRRKPLLKRSLSQ